MFRSFGARATETEQFYKHYAPAELEKEREKPTMNLRNNRRLTPAPFLIIAILFAGTWTSAQDDSSRQITLDRFNKARPESAAGAVRRPNPTAMRPRYRRMSPRGTLTAKNSEDIGVTVWRLRQARPTDTGGRVLVLDGLKQEQWVPERIEAGTPLNIGDRVRLTIESPRPGYLYIIDREQYADGSLGEPMLIFPTLRTRGGDNRVEPGKLIDIPAQEDQYTYFTAQPSGERRDQVAEVLTIILVTQPLPLQIGEQPLRIAQKELTGWQSLWGGATEHLELVNGAGRAWTNEEKEAGRATGPAFDEDRSAAANNLSRRRQGGRTVAGDGPVKIRAMRLVPLADQHKRRPVEWRAVFLPSDHRQLSIAHCRRCRRGGTDAGTEITLVKICHQFRGRSVGNRPEADTHGRRARVHERARQTDYAFAALLFA